MKYLHLLNTFVLMELIVLLVLLIWPELVTPSSLQAAAAVVG